MAGKTHGKNGSITINGSKLVTATAWHFAPQRQYAEVTVFDDNGATFAAGQRTVDVSFEGLLDVGNSQVWAAATADLCDVALYAEDGSLVGSGKGYVDAQAGASVNDAVRMSGTVKGSGGWVPFVAP